MRSPPSEGGLLCVVGFIRCTCIIRRTGNTLALCDDFYGKAYFSPAQTCRLPACVQGEPQTVRETNELLLHTAAIPRAGWHSAARCGCFESTRRSDGWKG